MKNNQNNVANLLGTEAAEYGSKNLGHRDWSTMARPRNLAVNYKEQMKKQFGIASRNFWQLWIASRNFWQLWIASRNKWRKG